MSAFNYYDFRIKNVKDKITEEIAYYENHEYSKICFEPYLLYLKDRIGLDRIESSTKTHYDNSGNKMEFKKMNIDEYVKDMDICTFTKPWIKLKEIHKVMKIKEYIDNLPYNKNKDEKSIVKNKIYLKKEICEGLKTKKFGKNKSQIEYDQEKMVITYITSIDYNKKKKLYEIDWD